MDALITVYARRGIDVAGIVSLPRRSNLPQRCATLLDKERQRLFGNEL